MTANVDYNGESLPRNEYPLTGSNGPYVMKNPKDYAIQCFNEANSYFFHRRYELAIDSYYKSARFFKQVDFKQSAYFALICAGKVQSFLSRVDAARVTFERAERVI